MVFLKRKLRQRIRMVKRGTPALEALFPDPASLPHLLGGTLDDSGLSGPTLADWVEERAARRRAAVAACVLPPVE